LEFRFEAKGKRLIALDTGWKKNGCSIYEIQDETDAYIDTVIVHPLDSVADVVDSWVKKYQR
jgi:hypothetical protein